MSNRARSRYERTGFVPEPNTMSTEHLASSLHYTQRNLEKAEFVRARWCQPSDMEQRQDAVMRGMRQRIAALEYEINVRLVRAVGRAG